jgi:pimeloyl-ACP methyl ester carboxylesterase
MSVAEAVNYTGDGVDLVGTCIGDGPTVLLLHGGGQTRHSWDQTARRLAASGYTAIALDMRGHGDSGWSPDGHYGFSVHAQDLRAVLGQLDDRPAIIGASMGGVAGLVALGEDPAGGVGMATSLVLVDVTPRMEPEGIQRIREFMTGRPEGFASLEEAADAVASYLPDRPRPPSTAGLAKNLRLHPDNRYRWHWDPQIMDNMPEQRVLHNLLVEAARGVQVPTLLVRGARSDVVSNRGIEELSTLIPHVQIAEVADAGHMVAGDSNDPFSAEIIAFLDRL